ncbi:MAG: hypothetical protein WC980_01645 [Candidatus Brocadiia bacterium]
MTIQRYDEPFHNEPEPAISEDAVELHRRLVNDGVIPPKGPMPLTLELVQTILKAYYDLFSPRKEGVRETRKLSEYTDRAFKIYSMLNEESAGTIEVTPELMEQITNMITFGNILDAMEIGHEMGLDKMFGLTKYDWTEADYLSQAAKQEHAGNNKAALAAYDQAVKHHRTGHIFPLIHRGKLLAKLGRADDAIADFTRAIKEGELPDDFVTVSQAYAERAEAYIKKGSVEKGLNDLIWNFGRYRREFIKKPFNRDLLDVDSDDFDMDLNDLSGRAEFDIERAVELIHTIERDRQPSLTKAETKKLARIKELVLAVRNQLDF